MNSNPNANQDVPSRRELWGTIQIKRIFSPIPISWEEVEEILPFLNRQDALQFLAGDADDFNRRVLYNELFRWHPALRTALYRGEETSHSSDQHTNADESTALPWIKLGDSWLNQIGVEQATTIAAAADDTGVVRGAFRASVAGRPPDEALRQIALELLDEDDRELIQFRVLDGYSTDVTAQRLGLTRQEFQRRFKVARRRFALLRNRIAAVATAAADMSTDQLSSILARPK